MTPGEKLRLAMKADIFKAMGQPTRLGIIELLQEREMQVGEIALRLDVNTPSVSKHLSFLRTCGIVRSRKAGFKIYYALTMPQLEPLMRCVEEHRRRQIKEPRTASSGKVRNCVAPDRETEC